MGGWPAPAGIEFVVGEFNTPMLLLVSLIAVVAAVYGRRSVAAEIDGRRSPLFYACLCLTLAGLLGLAVTGDAFNAFVFLEISSLSTYALIAMGRRRRALLASFRYLVIGTVGATFVLIGIGLAYAVTGTLNMADLAQRLTGVDGNRALYAAVVFVFVGLGGQDGRLPAARLAAGGLRRGAVGGEHVPRRRQHQGRDLRVRAGSPSPSSARRWCSGRCRSGRRAAAGRLAMLVGSAAACFQNDLRYLLAWSSVAQIGYIVAGISLATAAGVSAGYLHMINHA